MRRMYMNRDFFLMSTSGHNVQFIANEPTNVHDFVIEEAIALGAVYEDGSLHKPEEKVEDTPEELFGQPRKDAILKALNVLKDRSDADDFTANSLPKLKSVVEEVGFNVDRKEVDTEWRAILAARANAL